MDHDETGATPRASFDAWTAPHLDCLFRAARRILPSDDLAQDAVQETLLRFWRWRTRPEKPRSALLGVLRPTSLQILRSDRRRAHHEGRAREWSTEAEQCTDPVCALERRELVAHLQAAVDALPDDCRDALRLRAVHDLDYGSIARSLRLPLGTVRSRIHRGRRLLRTALESGRIAIGPTAIGHYPRRDDNAASA